MSLGAACALVGVGKSAVDGWLRRGRKERRRLRKPEAVPEEQEADYVRLLESLERANAQAEADAVGIIQAAALQNGKAAAGLLERRWPQRWANHAKEIRELAKRVKALQDSIELRRLAGPAVLTRDRRPARFPAPHPFASRHARKRTASRLEHSPPQGGRLAGPRAVETTLQVA